MARRVFFSFHYQQDIWRVNQIRNLPEIVDTAAAGFHDASLWEAAKRQGDAVIKRMIDDALLNTSVTLVCIGSQTANRKYVGYEIQQSQARGNALLGVRIHHLRNQQGYIDTPGAVPYGLTAAGAPIYNYSDHVSLNSWIETAARRAGK